VPISVLPCFLHLAVLEFSQVELCEVAEIPWRREQLDFDRSSSAGGCGKAAELAGAFPMAVLVSSSKAAPSGEPSAKATKGLAINWLHLRKILYT
jgi:hypothetical protein